MSLASISQNISTDVPVDIRWSSNGRVSICFPPSALSSFKSNIPITQPVNLILLPHESKGFDTSAGSLISSNVTGDLYVWTPSNSLVLGGFYLIKLSQHDGQVAYSHDLVCTETSTTVTVIIICCTALPPASQSSASQSFASQSSVSQSSASSSPKLQNSPARQRTLSQSTIVGVAVGVAVFILLILTFAILCWRHRRRSLEKAAIELPGHQTDAEVKSDPHTTIWVPELGQE